MGRAVVFPCGRLHESWGRRGSAAVQRRACELVQGHDAFLSAAGVLAPLPFRPRSVVPLDFLGRLFLGTVMYVTTPMNCPACSSDNRS